MLPIFCSGFAQGAEAADWVVAMKLAARWKDTMHQFSEVGLVFHSRAETGAVGAPINAIGGVVAPSVAVLNMFQESWPGGLVAYDLVVV